MEDLSAGSDDPLPPPIVEEAGVSDGAERLALPEEKVRALGDMATGGSPGQAKDAPGSTEDLPLPLQAAAVELSRQF